MRLSSSCTIACGARWRRPATPGRARVERHAPAEQVDRGRAPQVADGVLLVVDGEAAGGGGGHPAVAEVGQQLGRASARGSGRRRGRPRAAGRGRRGTGGRRRAGGSRPGPRPRGASRRRGGSRRWSGRRRSPASDGGEHVAGQQAAERPGPTVKPRRSSRPPRGQQHLDAEDVDGLLGGDGQAAAGGARRRRGRGGGRPSSRSACSSATCVEVRRSSVGSPARILSSASRAAPCDDVAGRDGG